MFAMLFAIAVCRAESPATDTRSADDDKSSNTAAPLRRCVVTAGPWRSLSDPCSYPPIRPGAGSAEGRTVAPGLLLQASRALSSRSHCAVEVHRPVHGLTGLDPGRHRLLL